MMDPTTWFLDNWKLVLLAALTAALAGVSYLWIGEVRAFAEYKGVIKQAGKDAEIEKERVEGVHRKTLEDVSNAWNKELPLVADNAVSAYRQRYINGVSIPACANSLPGHAGGPQVHDGAIGERVASGTTTQPPDSFIAACGKDALKLRRVREWVTGNGLVVK